MNRFVFRIDEIVCNKYTQDEFHLPLLAFASLSKNLNSISQPISESILSFTDSRFTVRSIFDSFGLFFFFFFYFVLSPLLSLSLSLFEKESFEGQTAIVLNFTGSPIAISA